MNNLVQKVRFYEFMQECRDILSYVDDYLKATPKEQEEILNILYSSKDESEALMNLYYEIEQNFYLNVLNYAVYFHRIYNEGIIDMMCQFQYKISLIQEDANSVNLQKFPVARYHNEIKELNILDFLNSFCHADLYMGAYQIRQYALSVGHEDIKDSEELMKEKMANQDFGGFFFRIIGRTKKLLLEDDEDLDVDAGHTLSTADSYQINDVLDNDTQPNTPKTKYKNIIEPTQRTVIFAHNYRADAGIIPKINSKKGWKEHGEQAGVSGNNRANAFYTTNPSSKSYDPPRLEEIAVIFELLSEDPIALESAKKGILNELSATKSVNGELVMIYKERYIMAKQYIENYHQ